MKPLRTTLCVLLAVVLMIEQPQLLKRRGAAWQRSSSPFDRTFVLNESTNVNSSIPVYDIIYNMNLGANHYLNPNVYYEQLLPLKLMPPEREGYNFAGWYLDSSYKFPITEIEDCDRGNLILYAKWTKKISNSMNIQMYSYVSGSLTRAPEKKLSNMNYRILENIDIPGMPYTRFADYGSGRTYSLDQCPQGLCISDDFIMVSTYSTGSRRTSGCLHIFDVKTGEYLVTLSMREGSHLGGIAFDGENIWICHSNYRTIQRLDYAFVKEIAAHKPKKIIDISGITEHCEEYRVSNSPSCITYYNGKLWIATHTRFFKSVMRSYRFEDDALVECEEFAIPDKVQGVAFDGDGHVYLSASFGRGKSSYIKFYDSAYALSKDPEKPAECVEMPPCSEEVEILDDELIVLFESGAQKYHEGTDGNGKSLSPIDHLVAVSVDSF